MARAAGLVPDADIAPHVTFPGCTAVVALLVGACLTVGNLGDGRAVIGGSRGAMPLTLTRPHTAEDPGERDRLARRGTPAVWHEGGGGWRLPGSGLQVTRSVGDYDGKGYAPTPLVTSTDRGLCGSGGAGVTAEPEVVQVMVSERHVWLILGSDGLWDVLSAAAVARLVADTVKHPAMCARRLVAEALDAGSKDNTSAVVAYLQPVTSLEKVFAAGGGTATVGTALNTRNFTKTMEH
jgi:serine/threonine protein phosphatase PrpC